MSHAQTDKEYLNASCAEVARKFTASTPDDDIVRDLHTEFLESYKGKWVRWSGTVRRIGETLGGMELGVQCLPGALTTNVIIFFAGAAWKPKLAQLSTGQQVQFTGQLDDLNELGEIAVIQGELGTDRTTASPELPAARCPWSIGIETTSVFCRPPQLRPVSPHQ